jgi:hypothetical protein
LGPVPVLVPALVPALVLVQEFRVVLGILLQA